MLTGRGGKWHWPPPSSWSAGSEPAASRESPLRRTNHHPWGSRPFPDRCFQAVCPACGPASSPGAAQCPAASNPATPGDFSNPSFWDVMWAGACAGLPGEGPAALGLRRAGPGKTVSPEGREVGFGGSKCGSLCWLGAASCRCTCVSGERAAERELAPRGLVCPERPLWGSSKKGRASPCPAVCHRHSSEGCSLPAGPGVLACLPSRRRGL